MSAPDARARNEAARDRAAADPEAVADAAVRSATLAEILRDGDGIETRDGLGTVRTDVTEATDKEAELARTNLIRYVAGRLSLRAVLTDLGGVSRADAANICHDLARIPAGNDLAALTLVVEEMPAEVTPDHRTDKRILPRIVEGAHHPDRERGMLFGGLHEGRRIEAPELPLFPDFAPAKRVPMLDLVDAAGLPVMARGRGAPLPLRLFVRTLASVRPTDRKLASVRLALTLRELRDGLFPNGWRSGQHWPELRHALLHARDYAIHDGRGRWFPVALRYLPDTPDLDDLVVLDVAYPPGSHSGPTVRLPAMDQLSVTSAPRWRAYIAAHSLAWQPGTTRVPAPRAGGHYLWTRDRSAYPVLTVQDRLRLAFGEPGDNPNRRTRAAINAAFRDLPGLVVVSEQTANHRTGEVGWLVIPEDAARALADPEDTLE